MTPTLNPMKRRHARCRQTRAEMSDYLDGDLTGTEAALVERHVRWCPDCRRMLMNLSRTIGGLRSLREEPAREDGLEGR